MTRNTFSAAPVSPATEARMFRMPDAHIDGVPHRLVTGATPATYEPIPADELAVVPSAMWREGC